MKIKQFFFSIYYGQKIVKQLGSDIVEENCLFPAVDGGSYLSLKSISELTTEEIKELIRLKFHYDKGDVSDIVDIRVDNFRKNLGEYMIYGTIVHKNWGDHKCAINLGGGDTRIYSYVSDFLRSKGYAISFLDLNVSDLVEYGWIKVE